MILSIPAFFYKVQGSLTRYVWKAKGIERIQVQTSAAFLFSSERTHMFLCLHTLTHTPPHEKSWSSVTHAGVKTQRRGGRMTSQHPAEEEVPWTWTPFKTHARTHIHTRTHPPAPLGHISRPRHTCTLDKLFFTRKNTGCP